MRTLRACSHAAKQTVLGGSPEVTIPGSPVCFNDPCYFVNLGRQPPSNNEVSKFLVDEIDADAKAVCHRFERHAFVGFQELQTGILCHQHQANTWHQRPEALGDHWPRQAVRQSFSAVYVSCNPTGPLAQDAGTEPGAQELGLKPASMFLLLNR